MNFQWASLVDWHVGRLLLKSGYLLPTSPREVPLSEVQSLLVVKFFGMGSILEATPLFRALRQRFPEITLDILTFSDNEQIVHSLGLFDHVLVIDRRKNLAQFAKQTLAFLRRHAGTYTLVIDLEFFASYSALLTNMLSAPYSMGFGGFVKARNRCYSRTVVFDHSNHVRLVFLKFLDALGIERPAETDISPIHVPEEKKVSVQEKLPSLAREGTKIAVNINSSDLCPNRRWPEASFQGLITLLKREHAGLQIYLVGGEEDVPSVESFYESMEDRGGVHVVAGRLDILEFAHALTLTSCLISSDSGPVHIAEALKVPIVCFFGPETPKLYGPSPENNLVFYKNLYCSPCLNIHGGKKHECRDNICLKQLSVEEVFEEMRTFLPFIAARARCSRSNSVQQPGWERTAH